MAKAAKLLRVRLRVLQEPHEAEFCNVIRYKWARAVAVGRDFRSRDAQHGVAAGEPLSLRTGTPLGGRTAGMRATAWPLVTYYVTKWLGEREEYGNGLGRQGVSARLSAPAAARREDSGRRSWDWPENPDRRGGKISRDGKIRLQDRLIFQCKRPRRRQVGVRQISV